MSVCRFVERHEIQEGIKRQEKDERMGERERECNIGTEIERGSERERYRKKRMGKKYVCVCA